MRNSDDVFGLNNESQKLEKIINTALTKSDFSITEIIEVYYQVMNVSSTVTMLKQQFSGKDEHTSLLEKIQEIEIIISEKFNSVLHPQVMEKLSNLIENYMKELQSISTEHKLKQDIEKEAKIYEELRQVMSTKEFVKQYDKVFV